MNHNIFHLDIRHEVQVLSAGKWSTTKATIKSMTNAHLHVYQTTAET